MVIILFLISKDLNDFLKHKFMDLKFKVTNLIIFKFTVLNNKYSFNFICFIIRKEQPNRYIIYKVIKNEKVLIN